MTSGRMIGLAAGALVALPAVTNAQEEHVKQAGEMSVSAPKKSGRVLADGVSYYYEVRGAG